MDLAKGFLALANMASAAFDGAPFYEGVIVSQGTPSSYDDDGNFVPGSDPTERDCRVQVDALDARNRPTDWTDKDYRFIVLSASFTGDLDTDASIRIPTGIFAGQWLVSSLERDPAGIGYVGKGMKS